MDKTLAIASDRKVAIREYKNSTATTDKRLTFKEFGQAFQLEHGSADHRAEFSRYCASRNAEAVAYVEKARAHGLSLASSVETTDKETGEIIGVRIAFTKAKTPKVKAPKLKQEDILASLASLPKAELEALLAKLS
ncbi:MAG: hypothetical protein EBT48_01735 [Verrucomicrobia bacterium]|nr:hypothetical protein [Verrucomicrobiota bacterium]